MEAGGFEPPKAEPPDLQSGPFDRSGTPPNLARHCALSQSQSQPLVYRNSKIIEFAKKLSFFLLLGYKANNRRKLF